MDNKVTLYIATHNTTGLKYFGKSTLYNTSEELQEKYHGSGVYWTNHLKKHGDDVTMEIYGIYSLNEQDDDYVRPAAIKFSKINNIVESDEWANLIYENGLDGRPIGITHTAKTKQLLSEIWSNRTNEQKNYIINKQRETKNNKSEDDKKKTINKRKESLSIIEENGKTKAENSALKARDTMNIIQENGKTIRETAEEKRQETISIVQENGKTLQENMIIKSQETQNKIESDGTTIIQKRTENACFTKSKIIPDTNETGYERIGRLAKETKLQKGEDGLNSYERMGEAMKMRFNILKGGNVIHFDVCRLFLNDISPSLRFKTEKNPLGVTKHSKTILKKRGKEEYIGCYVEILI